MVSSILREIATGTKVMSNGGIFVKRSVVILTFSGIPFPALRVETLPTLDSVRLVPTRIALGARLGRDNIVMCV